MRGLSLRVANIGNIIGPSENRATVNAVNMVLQDESRQVWSRSVLRV